MFKDEVRLNGKVHTWEQVDDMPIDKIDNLMVEIENSIIDISIQIKVRENVDGPERNLAWINKAVRAKSILVGTGKRVANIKRKKNREIQHRFERLFVDSARELLPVKMFDKIAQSADDRKHNYEAV